MARSQVAVVTGAGSGIGRAVCQLLARHDWRLALVGRDESKLRATIAELGEGPAQSRESIVIPADISSQEQANVVIDRTIEKWGSLHALVNNAGLVEIRPIEQVDEQLLLKMFATNTFGPAYLIARAWPVFVKQRSGCVVNVSSMSSLDPFAGLSAYAASKAALEGLTRAVHSEGRHQGIRAFSVLPGAVETAMLRRVVSEATLPRQRALDPMQIAEVIVACIRGERDAEMGKLILAPSP